MRQGTYLWLDNSQCSRNTKIYSAMKIDFEANSVAQRCHSYIGKGPRGDWSIYSLLILVDSSKLMCFFGTLFCFSVAINKLKRAFTYYVIVLGGGSWGLAK